MMEKRETGKDRREYLIRVATPDDAPAVAEYLDEVLRDPMASIADRDEMNLDVWSEREHLRRIEANPLATALVAVHDGQVIGFLTCEGGRRRKVKHVADIGMSVRPEWRNIGVGASLLQTAEQWARSTGKILKLSLNVFEHNKPAIRLYQKCGFVQEGRLVNQIQMDGTFQDLLLMAKHL